MVNDNKNLQQFRYLVSKISDRLGQQNLAITMMVIANLLWPISFLYVSQHHFSPFQTNFIRGTAICVTHLLIGTYLGIPLSFKSWKQFKYLMIRNTLMVLHQLFYTAMHFVLSFPLINSIVITGPIFVFAIDYYINGITINRVQIIGMVVAFLGIFININGDLLIAFIDPSFQITSTYEHYEVTDIKTKVMYSLLGMMMNVLWGYAVVSQKIIKHVSGLQISYFLGVQFVFSSAICSNLGLVTPVTLSESLTACLLSGLLMAFCQLLFISGLNLSKNAGKMSILILLYAIPAYAISFFKFDEEINVLSLLGLVLMGFGLFRTVFGADK